MTDDVQAALTAAEWEMVIEAARVNRLSLQSYLAATNGEPFRLMAFANAAFPDGDPRKITQATVAALYGVLEAAAAFYKEHPPTPATQQEFVETQLRHASELRKTLVAILPPDEA